MLSYFIDLLYSISSIRPPTPSPTRSSPPPPAVDKTGRKEGLHREGEEEEEGGGMWVGRWDGEGWGGVPVGGGLGGVIVDDSPPVVLHEPWRLEQRLKGQE